jgi:hypothetical protein
VKAKTNVQLLNTTTFDSGALGMTAMVLHQFRPAGRYRAVVSEKGRASAEIDFEVDEKSEVMQLDIDLGASVRYSRERSDDCGCKVATQSTRVVSPDGYVLFHASSGGGYSVIVSDWGGKPAFDSAKLGPGDLFAVSLLEPARYSMANTLGSASGEIAVSLKPEMAKRIRDLETSYIEASEGKFGPERIDLTASQGLVFRINGTARILIEKSSPSRDGRAKPVARWRKLQTAGK